MWYSFFFFDRYRWLGGNCWPHHSCTRSWRQHIAAFVTQKTLILTLAAVRTWNLANSLYVLIWGQVTRVKRFGTILLPLAKIIGAELLPVFESWGCSRKYVIFNLSLSLSVSFRRLSCVLYGCCLPLQFEIRFQSTIPWSISRSEKWEAKSGNACRSYEESDGNLRKCTKLILGVVRGEGGLWVSAVQRNLIPSFVLNMQPIYLSEISAPTYYQNKLSHFPGDANINLRQVACQLTWIFWYRFI